MFEQAKYQELHSQRSAKIAAMLAEVEKQPDGPEKLNKLWLVKRMDSLNASEMATVMGLNKWHTQRELWNVKQGLAESKAGNAAFWGHALEDAIANVYSARLKVSIAEMGSVQSAEYPFLAGSVDRLVLDAEGKPVKILEIKTTRANYDTGDIDESGAAIKAWGPGNRYNSKGELEVIDNQVPIEYLIQVMTYMVVTGLRVADIAVLISGQDFRVYTINYDEEIASSIIKTADEWWCKYILDNQQPPAVESDLKGIVPEKSSSVQANASIVQTIDRLRDVKNEIKVLEEEEKALRNEVINFIGTNETITGSDGKALASYKWQKGRKRFNKDKFALEHPDLYKQYSYIGDGTRVLRLSRGGK